MQETQYSGDSIRQMFLINEEGASNMFEPVQAKFPWAMQTDYVSVSTPTLHEVLGEPVVTCVLPQVQTAFLLGLDCHPISARKFLLESGTSYLRAYRLFEGDKPAWAPVSAKILSYGVNMVDFGRPAPEGLDTFQDFYFSGEPADVEAHLGLPKLRGTYDTYYGVTVLNGAVVRCKQYVYNEQTAYSDWDVCYWLKKKQKEQAAEQSMV
jgi:hypothetical protein